MVAYRGSLIQAPRILNVDTRWKSAPVSRSNSFSHGKDALYAMNRKSGGSQSRSGCDDEDKIHYPDQNWTTITELCDYTVSSPSP
jgi:hypothetical protein